MVEMGREMDVIQAVRAAREYLNMAYADEAIRNVGLEEVVFDERLEQWKITLEFFRAWDPMASIFGSGDVKKRAYKVISINDKSGKAESIIDRILPNAEE